MRHKEFWIAFLTGSLAGAIAALLYAPQTGTKTRKQIKRSLAEAGEALEEAGEYLKSQAERLGSEAQKLMVSGTDEVATAADSASAYATAAASAAKQTRVAKAAQQLM